MMSKAGSGLSITLINDCSIEASPVISIPGELRSPMAAASLSSRAEGAG